MYVQISVNIFLSINVMENKTPPRGLSHLDYKAVCRSELRLFFHDIGEICQIQDVKLEKKNLISV